MYTTVCVNVDSFNQLFQLDAFQLNAILKYFIQLPVEKPLVLFYGMHHHHQHQQQEREKMYDDFRLNLLFVFIHAAYAMEKICCYISA